MARSALVTLVGNPARSTPNSARLDAALSTLDLMVSVDLYLDETTRYVDVTLPALGFVPVPAGDRTSWPTRRRSIPSRGTQC